MKGRYLLMDTNSDESLSYLNNAQFVYEINQTVEHTGVCYGEFGAEEGFDVNLKRVSHTVRNVSLEDGKIYADVNILNTVCGREVKELFTHFGDDILKHLKFVPKILMRKYFNPFSFVEEDEVYAVRWNISYNF